MSEKKPVTPSGIGRRELLLGAVPAAATVATLKAKPIPQVSFGPQQVSRLIVGGNPISGGSHLSSEMNREMVDYFTAENVKRLLRNCESAGINTWQSRGDRHIMRLLHEHRQSEGTLNWIAQTASEMASIPSNIKKIAGMKPIGIYHHGSETDKLWQSGDIDQVEEMLKVIRQTGVQVGLGTHIPEVVDYAESKGWDLDFYMTCLYNLSRSKEEEEKLASGPFEGELFWDPDRERMLKRVRATDKTCLIFKVYGASRHCGSELQMEKALRLVRDYAKPSDCLIIGMFPKYSEQVMQNAELVRKVFTT